MKNATMFRFRPIYWGLILFIFVSCENFDDLTDPVLVRYNVPTEVLEMVFTPDIPSDIKNVDNFLDRIKQHGMVIHEGNSPPAIPGSFSNFTPGFSIGNHCIYDGSNSENEGFSYGSYEEIIRVHTDQNQNNFLGDISYTSIFNPDYPDYPVGLDSGSGRGYVSGEGDDFTIFTKVTNGSYGDVSYSAIWIISGTYAYIVGSQYELRNVTKCMIMLEKSEDPGDRVANRGTVRIFKDDAPQRIRD
ncbi:hypothetical protein [Cyclobacterium salsum]|uniref:hypothetical protein n=1 Tax=Cyclobacterium salsum TaxID=2666329 RepID=UPI00139095E1|nr:hypothetical protein [Cyclobacterium salsum]